MVTPGLRVGGRFYVMPNSEMTLETYVMNLTFSSLATAPAGILAVCMLTASVALYCVIKLHLSDWLFIVTSPRHTCANNNNLSGGWIILTKVKCTLT